MQALVLFVCASVYLWMFTEAQTADPTVPGRSPCRPPGIQHRSCHTGCPPALSGTSGTSPDMNSGRWLAPALPAAFRLLAEGLKRIWEQTRWRTKRQIKQVLFVKLFLLISGMVQKIIFRLIVQHLGKHLNHVSCYLLSFYIVLLCIMFSVLYIVYICAKYCLIW